jgi:DNA-binding NtrC family response regulator
MASSEGGLSGWKVIGHAYRASTALRLALFTGQLEDDLKSVFRSNAAVPSFKIFVKPDLGAVQAWMHSIRTAWDASFGLALHDASTREIYETLVPTYATSRLPILILGESGTGKEGLATLIHERSGRTRFVPVNSGGLESASAFSELFGHTAGAFADVGRHALGKILEASGYKPGTAGPSQPNQSFVEWFHEANPDAVERDGLLTSRAAEQSAGTLFLDEVGTLPPQVMSGLLRILETGDVVPFGHHGPGIRSYCRIIAATNETDLVVGSDGGAEGRPFRRDLFYRLAGAILTLPPLRERDAGDIRHFLHDIVWTQLGVPPVEVSRAALQLAVELYQDRNDATARHYQRGNFRTLRNLAHRAYLIARSEGASSIEVAHIKLAEKHGQIVVPSIGLGGSAEHIRNVFSAALRERQVNLRESFSLVDLREITSKHPVETAYAFLRCALIVNNRSAKGEKYFQQNEISAALLRGLPPTPNIWLNKDLLGEHLCEAAAIYFAVKVDDGSAPKIRDVLKAVRKQKASEDVAQSDAD